MAFSPEADVSTKPVWRLNAIFASQFKIDGPMAAIRLPNGNTLMSGAAGEIIEAHSDAKEFIEVPSQAIPVIILG
jgi:hypothetical protein